MRVGAHPTHGGLSRKYNGCLRPDGIPLPMTRMWDGNAVSEIIVVQLFDPGPHRLEANFLIGVAGRVPAGGRDPLWLLAPDENKIQVTPRMTV